MLIGCPKEIKIKESRVGLVPSSAHTLIASGHKVIVQKGAGVESGIADDEYEKVGAQIVDSAHEVWGKSDLIVKVKEPVKAEYDLIRDEQIIYTFLHLAAEPDLTQVLLKKKVSGVAYETIQVNGALPLLKPSSEVAGRMAIQVSTHCLEKQQGGRGILLSGVPGVPRGKVTIIGGGVVGSNAAKIAVGLGASVTIIDTNLQRLEYLDDIFYGRIHTLYSSAENIERAVIDADVVVGAVLLPGAKAPKLVRSDYVKKMKPGSVIVDVAVDQGGCVETMRPTTHDDPIFMVDDVVHYGVTNMPGAVPRTSTFALSHATLPFMKMLADLGVKKACKEDASLLAGLNTYGGNVTYKAVAEAHGLQYVPFSEMSA